MKEKPVLYSFDKNPNDYDLIFIGTPVWAFSYAPAFNSFFDKIKIINKKIALFSCSG
jgi:flavodoxin